MPTQPRKLFYHHWHAYAGGVRRRSLIVFDWAAPAVWMTTGAWGINEEMTWGGPKVDMDPAAFSVSEAIGYAGPTMGMSAGGFVVEVQLPTSGPTMTMEPGQTSYTISEDLSYAGPVIGMNAGAWSFEVSYPATGASVAMDAGASSFEEQLSYTGPSIGMSPGAFTRSITAVDASHMQYVDGTLTFAGETTVVLDPGLFVTGGDYAIFSYGSFPGGQAEIDAELLIDARQLPLAYVDGVEDRPGDKLIVLKLRSGAAGQLWPSDPTPTTLEVGKQFVDGNLNFAGATVISLDADLYATAGTYEVFEVTGTVTGLANVTCVSAAGLTCGAPYLDGNIVKVTLT